MRLPRFLIRTSELYNQLTCGPEGYSLCARFYKNKLAGRWHGRVMTRVSDTLFWFDPDHCRTAYLWRQRKMNKLEYARAAEAIRIETTETLQRKNAILTETVEDLRQALQAALLYVELHEFKLGRKITTGNLIRTRLSRTTKPNTGDSP